MTRRFDFMNIPRDPIFPHTLDPDEAMDKERDESVGEGLVEAAEPKRIYVASSWRNGLQPDVVDALRQLGHEVYDFRNPKPGDEGFHWSEIDPGWKSWKPEPYRESLFHPVAESGFQSDWQAMLWANTCVLVLPCGRSAHIEAGYFVGAGKRLIILLHEYKFEPELMYKMAHKICCSMAEVIDALKST